MSDVKPFVLDFDLVSGFCTSGKVKPTQRRVSDMVAQFANEAAARAMVEGGEAAISVRSACSFVLQRIRKSSAYLTIYISFNLVFRIARYAWLCIGQPAAFSL